MKCAVCIIEQGYPDHREIEDAISVSNGYAVCGGHVADPILEDWPSRAQFFAKKYLI